MDSLHLLLIFVALFFLMRLVWSRHRFNSKSLKPPPSPPGLPVIGHMHMIGQVPHQSLHELSKKYGPIMLLKLGTTSTLVVSNAEMAKEILKTQDAIFYSKPYSVVGEYVVYNYQDLAFAPSGEHHTNLRKLLAQFFAAKRMDSVESLRTRELSWLMSRLLGESKMGQAVVLRKFLADFSFNLITPVLMGRTFFGPHGSNAEDGKMFREICDEIVEFAIRFCLSEYLPPALRWIDWNIFRAKKLQARLDRFLERMVDERIEKANKKSSGEFDDMLGVLLSNNAPREVIKALVMELVAAGSDTSTTAIEWALAELMNHPDSMQKVQQEIFDIVGNERMVKESDLPKLSYLHMVVKEIYRLHSPVKIVSRSPTSDCVVAGYDIPAGTLTYVNIHAIGRDPTVWVNPHEFSPERFRTRDVDFKGQDFELIPFGSGRRLCLGIPLAIKTVPVALANLVHGFDWRFTGGRKRHVMDDFFGAVTYMASPLEAIPVPRLLPQAYGKL